MNINDLEGEELFAYLRTNKANLLRAKTLNVAQTDPVTVEKAFINNEAAPIDVSTRDTLNVTVVASTSWLLNSQMDVVTDTAYAESILARGTNIPHIVDHRHEAAAHVGDVQRVYTSKIPLRDLGLNMDGETTALVMDSIVRKDYNSDVFKFYANGKINQHSIGFIYQDIKFAFNSNSKEDAREKAVWDEYYPKVLNKDVADKKGYFWVVNKLDVLENSAVLFGSNPLTPTLSVAALQNSPLGNTPIQPIGKTMTMTLEEAQGKIISLTEELSKAKDAISLAKLEAKTQEKARISNILKAQAVFGSDIKLQKAALSFIEKDLDVETATTSFEVIKEALQTSNHIDSTQGEASLNEGDVSKKELSPKDQLMAIAAAKQTKPDFGDML